MIGYICKYTPIEIIKSFDKDIERIDPSFSNFELADSLGHPNLCSYSKAVLEECFSGKYEGIILTSCCDSIRRLYDILLKKSDMKFIYMIDLPRKKNSSSIGLYENEIKKLISYCEQHFNKQFDKEKFLSILKNTDSTPNTTGNSQINLLVAGARLKDSTKSLINSYGGNIKYNLTCTNENRSFDFDFKASNYLNSYAKKLLQNQYSCMRMADISDRNEIFEKESKKVDGILYHTVKFCDFYSYDYASINKKVNVPILKIETDYSKQSEGQIKTRIEAFIESIKKLKHIDDESSMDIDSQAHDKKTITAGIDSGSLSTNVVIIDDEYKILSYSIIKTGAKSIESAKKAFKEAIDNANLSENDIDYVVSTGYGRAFIPFSNKHITEITCHAKGAHFLNKDIRTIIDIGGQDSKVIKLDENGNVIDFAMNDKCAAGTGRFLEMMAKTLEIPLDSMGVESMKWKEEITITSMCTVFAESEVVSLIAQNKERADIIMGLNNSIASRTMSLLNRIEGHEDYMMSGGVAKNVGVVYAIEKKLGKKIFIPDEPQIVGALGAAIIALESIESKEAD